MLRSTGAPNIAASFIRASKSFQTAPISRRFLSSAPPPPPRISKSSGSWRGTFLRWGAAAGVIYYYNTSSVFADTPGLFIPADSAAAEQTPHTIESITAERRRRIQAEKQAAEKAKAKAAATAAADEKAKLKDSEKLIQSDRDTQTDSSAASESSESLSNDSSIAATAEGTAEISKEAAQQGAFNPETGEINWDCPCLGGMADGPCGEKFKTAFSCFVFSKEEPKGMDCIEHFKAMQDCFREHPEIYASEIEDEEALDAEDADSALETAASSKDDDNKK